jgi:hypothetical protein
MPKEKKEISKEKLLELKEKVDKKLAKLDDGQYQMLCEVV